MSKVQLATFYNISCLVAHLSNDFYYVRPQATQERLSDLKRGRVISGDSKRGGSTPVFKFVHTCSFYMRFFYTCECVSQSVNERVGQRGLENVSVMIPVGNQFCNRQSLQIVRLFKPALRHHPCSSSAEPPRVTEPGAFTISSQVHQLSQVRCTCHLPQQPGALAQPGPKTCAGDKNWKMLPTAHPIHQPLTKPFQIHSQLLSFTLTKYCPRFSF